MKKTPDLTVYFYLPFKKDGITDIPNDMKHYWSWVCKNSSKGEGKYSWTLQTFLYLRDFGFPCELVSYLPKNGIVISHRDFLPSTLKPNHNLYLVCIKPARKEHSWVNHYVLQSFTDPILKKWPRSTLIRSNLGHSHL